MKSKLFIGLFVIINLAVIAAMVFILKPDWRIGGDGFGYYSYIRSVVFDHDFNFKNEYTEFDRFYGTHAATRLTPTGKVANLYSVGPAILVSPFFAGAYMVDKSHPQDSEYKLAGFNKPYQVAIFFAAVFYFLIGLLFIFWSLDVLFSRAVALVAGTATWLLSPLIFYIIYEPSMSHVFSFFALSGLFYFCLRSRNNISKKDYIILGLWFGLAMLVRWQNIVVVLLPLYVLFSNRLMYWTDKLKSLLYFSVTAGIVFLPQILMWHYLFGSWILIPQGNDFFNWQNPQVINFLFSGWHGLFFWQPWLIFGVIGLLFLFMRDKFLAIILFLILAGQIYINSATVDWTSGSAFGARRMTDYIFIFATGFGCIFMYLDAMRSPIKKIMYFILAIGIIWNLGLLIAVGQGRLPLDKEVSIKQMAMVQEKNVTIIWSQLGNAYNATIHLWNRKK